MNDVSSWTLVEYVSYKSLNSANVFRIFLKCAPKWYEDPFKYQNDFLGCLQLREPRFYCKELYISLNWNSWQFLNRTVLKIFEERMNSAKSRGGRFRKRMLRWGELMSKLLWNKKAAVRVCPAMRVRQLKTLHIKNNNSTSNYTYMILLAVMTVWKLVRSGSMPQCLKWSGIV